MDAQAARLLQPRTHLHARARCRVRAALSQDRGAPGHARHRGQRPVRGAPARRLQLSHGAHPAQDGRGVPALLAAPAGSGVPQLSRAAARDGGGADRRQPQRGLAEGGLRAAAPHHPARPHDQGRADGLRISHRPRGHAVAHQDHRGEHRPGAGGNRARHAGRWAAGQERDHHQARSGGRRQVCRDAARPARVLSFGRRAACTARARTGGAPQRGHRVPQRPGQHRAHRAARRRGHSPRRLRPRPGAAALRRAFVPGLPAAARVLRVSRPLPVLQREEPARGGLGHERQHDGNRDPAGPCRRRPGAACRCAALLAVLHAHHQPRAAPQRPHPGRSRASTSTTR
jgi:hypothetical protein